MGIPQRYRRRSHVARDNRRAFSPQYINLTTTTISDFIQQAFISGDQTPVFAHVYTPILGAHEVLVPNHHIPEALEFIKPIKTELCRIMNHRAIITNFLDYDDIILSTTTVDCWKPFNIQLSIAKSSDAQPDQQRAR
jgi:hypothetical protein